MSDRVQKAMEEEIPKRREAGEKTPPIKASEIPRVLLLGNGLNRCFGGISWEGLIASFPNGQSAAACTDIPMPLRMILATGGEVSSSIEKKIANQSAAFYGNAPEPEYADFLKEILKAGFSDILTTNYSYELEMAALGLNISSTQPQNMAVHIGDQEKNIFCMHTIC